MHKAQWLGLPMAESDSSDGLPPGPKAVPYIPRSISRPSTPSSSGDDHDVDVQTRDFWKLAQRNGHPLNDILKTGQRLSTMNYIQSVPRIPQYPHDDDVSSQFYAIAGHRLHRPPPKAELHIPRTPDDSDDDDQYNEYLRNNLHHVMDAGYIMERKTMGHGGLYTDLNMRNASAPMLHPSPRHIMSPTSPRSSPRLSPAFKSILLGNINEQDNMAASAAETFRQQNQQNTTRPFQNLPNATLQDLYGKRLPKSKSENKNQYRARRFQQMVADQKSQKLVERNGQWQFKN